MTRLCSMTTKTLLLVVALLASRLLPCTCFIVKTATTTTTPTRELPTLVPLPLPPSTPKRNPKQEEPKLKLDPQGNLRLGKQVLLNGFLPTVWSAIRPNDANDIDDSNNDNSNNGLFLHTNYVKESSEHEQVLGDLMTCHRLLACARQNRYWMGPKFGDSARDIPFDTQFLLMQLDEDDDLSSDEKHEPTFALFLPLLDNGFRASLQNGHHNGSIKVFCVACSGDASAQSKGMRALYVETGKDPFKLIQHAFQQVSKELGTFQTLANKQIPPFVDEFGWCTWDAFYSNVTAQGVLDGVQALKQAGTPPRTLILDDGWQQVSPEPPLKQHISSPNKQTKTTTGLLQKVACTFFDTHVRKAAYGSWGNRLWITLVKTVLKRPLWEFLNTETDFTRQLAGFEPNGKFESLKSLVSQLKNELGVHNVVCWHALHGYWRGVSPELGRQAGLDVTTVFPHPTHNLKRLEPLMESDPVNLFGVGLMSSQEDLTKFYKLLHTPLQEAGVDGVKVDVQSGVSAAGCDGMGGGPTLAKLYTGAMEESVQQRFASANKQGAVNVINCMCHSTENLYRYNLTAVARASEDFFPDRSDSQTAHLINVAFNSLFVGEICLPDWDMFHSYGPAASLHAAARAIGGCPVYVSDAPGKHDPKLLRKLVLPDGSILRAQLPGRPTRDCLFANVAKDNVPLKIWNFNGGGSGVVGAFHVQGVEWNFDTRENEKVAQPVPLVASVKPYDVETLRDHPGPFAVWRHQSSQMEFLATGDSVSTCPLKPQEWEVFTVVPLQVSQDDKIMWGPVGLVDMINSGGALVQSNPLEEDRFFSTKTQASCTSRGPGRFVAFTNRRPSSVSVNGKEIKFDHEKDTCQLSFTLPVESEEGKHQILVEWNK